MSEIKSQTAVAGLIGTATAFDHNFQAAFRAGGKGETCDVDVSISGLVKFRKLNGCISMDKSDLTPVTSEGNSCGLIVRAAANPDCCCCEETDQQHGHTQDFQQPSNGKCLEKITPTPCRDVASYSPINVDCRTAHLARREHTPGSL